MLRRTASLLICWCPHMCHFWLSVVVSVVYVISMLCMRVYQYVWLYVSVYCVWFWRYLTRELSLHLSQSSIRPSIYLSSIVKSRSNPFLESTSTKARTHDLHITSQTCNSLRVWSWMCERVLWTVIVLYFWSLDL